MSVTPAMARPSAEKGPISLFIMSRDSAALFRGAVGSVKLAERSRVARGHIGIFLVGADERRDFPRARAFLAFRALGLDRDAGDIFETKRGLRPLSRHHLCRRRDANLGHVDAFERRAQLAVGNVDDGCGFERGADPLLHALDFERAGDDAAYEPDIPPFFGKRIVAPSAGDFRKRLQMNGGGAVAEAREPYFFHRETQNRREPGGEAAK